MPNKQFGLPLYKELYTWLIPSQGVVDTPELYGSESVERISLWLQRRVVSLCQACQDLPVIANPQLWVLRSTLNVN